jgi:hypothetical protein
VTQTPTATAPLSAEPTTPVTLLTLTDEELAVLGAAQGIGVLPIWAEMDQAQRDMGARTAFRGLIARGLVDMPTDEALATYRMSGPDADLQIELRTDLKALITLRQGSSAVIAIARTASGGQDFAYVHVVGDFVLVEEVDPAGLHAFATSTSEELAGLLAGAVLHPDAADGTGEPIDVAAGAEAPAALVAALGDTHLRADIVLRRRDDSAAPLTGIFSGPEGTWLVQAGSGAGHTVSARPVSVSEARETLAGLAAQAARYALDAAEAGA